LSHITIIINSAGDNPTVAKGTDEISLTYQPPDDASPIQIGRAVARRINWISKFMDEKKSDDIDDS
jgi:hypothetical protein